MFEKIRKRDGNVVEFDSSKITAAIVKAGKATGEFGERETKKLTARVLDLAHELSLGPQPDVEGVQDIVERVLFDTAFFKSAKAYILYREQHAQIRAIAAKASVDLVDSYIKKLDWKISENSNMSYSLQGLNNYISSDITSKYWLNRIYPPEIRHSHVTGEIHIHDLNLLSVYCVGWDLKDLLVQGFRGVEGKVESAPPKHLRSALGQIVNFFYTLQGEAAGAQAFSNFDTLLAPFIRYDNLNYKEVKQALQEFVFNINIPTRVGFQTPFTNITMDLCPPTILRDQPVIIGGIEQESTCSEFQPEMDMLNCAFAEVMLEGDAKGIRCYLLKDFEPLMMIPNQTPGSDFFIHDCDVFDAEYSAFNTHDFQSQMWSLNKYGYAMKKIMEDVKNMAIMHSCCTYPEQRQDVYRKYEAFVNCRFRNRLLSLIKQYIKVEHEDRRNLLKQKIAELNRRILECKRIWERYAPPENWDH